MKSSSGRAASAYGDIATDAESLIRRASFAFLNFYSFFQLYYIEGIYCVFAFARTRSERRYL